MGLLEHVEEGGTVDGCNHEDFIALGDHVLYLGYLRLNVILGELEVGLVATGLEDRLHGAAVLDPARGRLGGHRDADGLLG